MLFWNVKCSESRVHYVRLYPELTLIAAIAIQNRAIGFQGKLPWHLPDDLARFKRLTYGYATIVGRKTWQTDLRERILPGRQTIVVSATLAETPNDRDELCFAASLSEAFDCVRGDRAFVIGGASIYEQTLTLADRLELTLVGGEWEGDVFFPEYEAMVAREFVLEKREMWPEFECITYRRQPHREGSDRF